MKHCLALILMLAPAPALAGVEAVVDRHILPGYTAFAASAAGLRDTAAADCGAPSLRPAWNAALDAWLGVSHLRFGPVEDEGRAIRLAFWPDERGATPRALARLMAERDPVIATPEGTAQVSAAARGFFALEYLLYDPQFAEAGNYGCTLVRALSADMARIAGQVAADWRDGYADLMLSAGAPGNSVYLGAREAKQVLFTALLSGLEFTADQRLGRPMGTFERPRPARAENWRSGRSQRNVVLSLHALADLATDLADAPIPHTHAAFARAIELAEDLGDPAFAGVADPAGRLRVEIVQQAVRAAKDAALAELGPALGVAAGFNSADGD